MKIRHTVIFTFYDTTTQEQIDEVIKRLDALGEYVQKELGVTDWVVAKHIPETNKPGRAHLIQDGTYPNLEAIQAHGQSDAHKHVVELTPKVCDWMAIDTYVD